MIGMKQALVALLLSEFAIVPCDAFPIFGASTLPSSPFSRKLQKKPAAVTTTVGRHAVTDPSLETTASESIGDDLPATQVQVDEMVKSLGLTGDEKEPKKAYPWIAGAYVNDDKVEMIDSLNPATGKVVAQITSCGSNEVNQAVQAAREAFDDGRWSQLDPMERKSLMLKWADLIEQNSLELGVLDAIEGGKPITTTLEGDIPESVRVIQFQAELIGKTYDQVPSSPPDQVGMIVREPVGVCGVITPWNFPVQMAVWKFGPALATGNTIVIKPSEMTTLSCLRLAELAKEAGIPDGVINVVTGYGPTAGEALTRHMDVDMCGFTGSGATGRLVLKASADSNLKRVALECGGKSPQIIFEDAQDLDDVADNVMDGAYWNMGENCSCGSRLIVHKNIKDKLLEKLLQRIPDWTVGNPLDVNVKVGPMISSAHCTKVMSYVESAKKQATLVVGGSQTCQELGGDFVELTIFDNVESDMDFAQEEIFGPVLSILTFDTEEEAIFLANDTKYGLAASLYTSDFSRAHRMSRQIKAGAVSVNCFSEGSLATPFGGYKESGFAGRDNGVHAQEQYTELKTIWMQL
mmetsp:Transcript_8190/g.11807  ORF Transcript_8190/g.11807 Transcript_8190/m.11807 type:complete len:578 (+) Transcript_8190:118-1851(+)